MVFVEMLDLKMNEHNDLFCDDADDFNDIEIMCFVSYVGSLNSFVKVLIWKKN